VVFIVTATHLPLLGNISEVLSPARHCWNCCIQTLESWVFGHNTAVSPSEAGNDSFADSSAVADQLSTADSLIQRPASLQAWPKGLLLLA
jgi:hypothetical protein